MTAARRRDEILQALAGASGPVSAAALAARLGVSRQVVVGDVALLRAAGSPIVATPRGYVLVEFNGVPLGFEKNIGNRANNLYPAEWKVKSSHVPDEYNEIIRTK